MSTKKYRIRLTTDEQQELNALVSRGRAAAYKQTHARRCQYERCPSRKIHEGIPLRKQ